MLDPSACINVDDPGYCMGAISRDLAEFHCADAKETEVKLRCLDYLFSYAMDFHSLKGVDKYKEYFVSIYDLSEGYPGRMENLFLQDDGNIIRSTNIELGVMMYFDEENSLILRDVGLCDQVKGTQTRVYRLREGLPNMYITDCTIIEEQLSIEWFECHFPW